MVVEAKNRRKELLEEQVDKLDQPPPTHLVRCPATYLIIKVAEVDSVNKT